MIPLSAVLSFFRRPPAPAEEPQPEPVNKRAEIRIPTEGSLDVLWFPDMQTAQTIPATAEDYSTSGMGLTVRSQFPVGALVWLMKSHSEAIKAVVRHCERVEDGLWRIGVRVVRYERRRADREPVSGAAELKWISSRGEQVSLPVQVVDLSDSGAGVTAAEPGPVGQAVQMVGGEFDCFAVIRHCSETANGRHHIGLLFARPPHNRAKHVVADWTD